MHPGSVQLEHPSGPRPPLVPAAARELALDAKASTVILVEGWSDQAAIETLARRRGWDLPFCPLEICGGGWYLPAACPRAGWRCKFFVLRDLEWSRRPGLNR